MDVRPEQYSRTKTKLTGDIVSARCRQLSARRSRLDSFLTAVVSSPRATALCRRPGGVVVHGPPLTTDKPQFLDVLLSPSVA